MTNKHRRNVVRLIALAQMLTAVYIIHTIATGYIDGVGTEAWSWHRFIVGTISGMFMFANNFMVWRAMNACLDLYSED